MTTNDNKNTTCLNLWDAAYTVLRGNSMALQVFYQKRKRYKINVLSFHLKKLKKEEKLKSNVNSRKQII